MSSNTHCQYLAGLEDLAAATDWLPDPVASGFPPVDEESMAPCMKNATDRACKASGMLPHFLLPRE